LRSWRVLPQHHLEILCRNWNLLWRFWSYLVHCLSDNRQLLIICNHSMYRRAILGRGRNDLFDLTRPYLYGQFLQLRSKKWRICERRIDWTWCLCLTSFSCSCYWSMVSWINWSQYYMSWRLYLYKLCRHSEPNLLKSRWNCCWFTYSVKSWLLFKWRRSYCLYNRLRTLLLERSLDDWHSFKPIWFSRLRKMAKASKQ